MYNYVYSPPHCPKKRFLQTSLNENHVKGILHHVMAHQAVVRFSLQECVHRKEGLTPSFVLPYVFHNLVNDLWIKSLKVNIK